MTEIFEQILAQRGLDEDFLRPRYEELFNPYDLLDMEKTVARIEEARDRGEKIVIYGDYDADGVTSSALMSEALQRFGCESVETILPNRFTDGYGMNLPAVPKIVACGAGLVITVDCGSGSEEAIAALREAGIDTIVTDHHEIPNVPKSAVAIINPKRAGETVGARMAGVGVAFAVARALNMRQNGGRCDGREKWLMDLVAIGTICDSMELRDENRILAYFGMKVLEKTRRPGLKELMARAGVGEKITSHAIGFQIGPRINAAGRMRSADAALAVVTAKQRAEAFALAGELDELNAERKRIQERAVKEAEMMINPSDAVIVVSGKWHEGIIGIVAGQLQEIYKKPTFVLAELGGGRLKGSGRSFGDFSLAGAIERCKAEGVLLGGGGHAAACGVTLLAEKLADFKQLVNGYYCSLNLANQERFLRRQTDVALDDFDGLNVNLYDEMQLLEPFGPGNEEPIFEIDGRVGSKNILKEKHLALDVIDGYGEKMRMMGFFAPDTWLELNAGDKIRVQFTLTLNEWRGERKIEGRIVSIEREKLS